MVSVKVVALLFVLMSQQTYVLSQRSPYAGSRPSGYKDRFVAKQNQSANANAIDSNDVINRFGADGDSSQRPPTGVQVVVGEPGSSIGNRGPVTPPTSAPAGATGQQPTRLPYDAHGDTELVNLLLSRPVEQRPFWLLNYEAIEAHRNSSRQGNFNPVATRSFFAGK